MVKTFNKKAAEKLSKKLTNEWKLNKYSRGYFYYQDINKNIFVSRWDRLNPANCVKILSHVPTYGKYMVMRAELVKLRRVVTSYVGKPIDYDIACEIVNKLLDDKKHLKKELDELKEKVADQRIDLESARWYQTVQNEDIGKLRGLLKECLPIVSAEIMTWQIRGGEESYKRGQDLLTRIKATIGESEE